MTTQVERLVPCQFSAYQLALNQLVEGEVNASDSATATKAVKKLNNTLMELRTICNHPLIRLAVTFPVDFVIMNTSIAKSCLSQTLNNMVS